MVTAGRGVRLSMHRSWLACAACSAGYVAVVGAFAGAPGPAERAAFQRLNDAGDPRWLRVPQQWGTPWTLVAASGVALARGRRPEALTGLACLPLAKGLEVATKEWVSRPRPVHTQPTELRDDAPVEGGSMPSGHAALAACATVVLAPLVPRAVAAGLAGLTAVSAAVRVHQGAHHPADVVAGMLLGGAVASLRAALLPVVAHA